MAVFRKKTTTTNIPELQEYYANQKRESTGLAWLLAVGSLLITAAVIIGLFIGGRWVYRKLANDDKSNTTSITDTSTPSQNTGTPPNPSSSTATTGTSTPTSTTPTTTPAQGVSPAQSESTNSSAVAATTSKTVPDTGAGNTIAIFAAVTVLSYAAHRSYLVKKTSR